MANDYWDKIRSNSPPATGSTVKVQTGDPELFSFWNNNPGRIILSPRREPVQVNLHFITRDSDYDPEHLDPGFFRCLGADCVYCLHISKSEEFLLLPVFSVNDGKLKILHIKVTDEDGCLLAIIIDAYQRKAETRKEVLKIKQVKTKSNRNRYITLPSEDQVGGEGDREIADFLKDVDGGKVRIEDVFPFYENEELIAGIEKVRHLHERENAKAKMKGPLPQPQAETRRVGGKPMGTTPPEIGDDDLLS